MEIAERALAASVFDQAVDGVDDFGAAAVVDGEVEAESGVGGGLTDGGFEIVANLGGEKLPAADGVEADAVGLQTGELAVEIDTEQAPEGVDLIARPLPVLDGEGLEGESVDSGAGAALDGGANGVDAGFVTGDAGEAALTRPAAVAIHNNGDVGGKAGGIDEPSELPVGMGRPERLQ